MMWIIPLSLLILFEAIADIFAKEWAVHGNWIRWTGAILGYVIANAFWLYALRSGSELAKGSTIFSVASAIIAVALGVLLYNEHVSTHQAIGISLGIASLVFLLS